MPSSAVELMSSRAPPHSGCPVRIAFYHAVPPRPTRHHHAIEQQDCHHSSTRQRPHRTFGRRDDTTLLLLILSLATTLPYLTLPHRHLFLSHVLRRCSTFIFIHDDIIDHLLASFSSCEYEHGGPTQVQPWYILVLSRYKQVQLEKRHPLHNPRLILRHPPSLSSIPMNPPSAMQLVQ